MIEIVLFILAGTLSGIVAGIIPGLHPNMVALVFSGVAYPLFPSGCCFLAFMVSMGMANTLSSFIPAVFVGCPDENSALSAAPGQRMLLSGMGHHAVKLSVAGSVGTMIFCAVLVPFAIIIFPAAYSVARPFTHLLLSAFVFIMIASERRKAASLFVFLASGTIGICGSSFPINPAYYLFPVLSGLFGVPLLLFSIGKMQKIPEQSKSGKPLSVFSIRTPVISGSAAGILTGLLPGIGPSQAAFAADAITRKKSRKRESFMIALGSVAAANSVFSLLALWLIGNPRSGVAVAIGNAMEIGFPEFLLIFSVAVASCGASAMATLWISERFSEFAPKIDYSALSVIMLAAIAVAVFVITSFHGILLLFATSSLGVFANLSRVSRSHMMGVLILPAILFFAGI